MRFLLFKELSTMLYGLLLTLFVFIGFLLVLIVLVQQSKSSLGLGSMGQTQMLFGGSGGQTLFQKITWGMGATFMALSLALSIMNSSVYQTRYLHSAAKNSTVIQPAVADSEKISDNQEQETTASEETHED